jgi:hypothetical protein
MNSYEPDFIHFFTFIQERTVYPIGSIEDHRVHESSISYSSPRVFQMRLTTCSNIINKSNIAWSPNNPDHPHSLIYLF